MTRETLALFEDDLEKLPPPAGVEVRVVAEDLRESPDRGERRPKFVRHRRHEVVLHPIELEQTVVGAA